MFGIKARFRLFTLVGKMPNWRAWLTAVRIFT